MQVAPLKITTIEVFAVATNLNEISSAIGALQEGQRGLRRGQDEARAERTAHALKTDERFDKLESKLDAAIDARIKKATDGLIPGGTGAIVVSAIIYLATLMGFKFPGGS